MKKRYWFYAGVAIGLTVGFMAGTALAAKTEMPIGAKIIQCGPPKVALVKCRHVDDRCCAVAPLWEIEPAAGEDKPIEDADGLYVEPEQSDDGVVVNFE